MARLAILDEKGVVQNIVIGDASEVPMSVDMDALGVAGRIGDKWNGDQFIPKEEEVRRLIPRQDFIDRFDFNELAAIKALARQQTHEGIKAEVFWEQVTSRDVINLDSPLSQAAKLALQGWGIIGSTRADEIFG